MPPREFQKVLLNCLLEFSELSNLDASDKIWFQDWYKVKKIIRFCRVFNRCDAGVNQILGPRRGRMRIIVFPHLHNPVGLSRIKIPTPFPAIPRDH